MRKYLIPMSAVYHSNNFEVGMLRKYILIIIVLLSCISAAAAAPVANFTAFPTSGAYPVQIQFSNLAMEFAATPYSGVWVEQTAAANFTARQEFATATMSDGSIVVMGGMDGVNPLNDVWRSTDKGVTWTQQTAAAGWGARFELSAVALPDNSIVILGGSNGGAMFGDVWRSTDYGQNWVKQTAAAAFGARTYQATCAIPNGSIVVLGGNLDGVGLQNDAWISNDKGATWDLVSAGGGGSARNAHNCAALSTGEILLMGGFDGGVVNDVWITPDYGATWVQQTAAAGWNARYNFNVEVLPDNSVVILAGTNGGAVFQDVWSSADKGVTWVENIDPATWNGRGGAGSSLQPDYSLIIIAGVGAGYYNDVWITQPVLAPIGIGATYLWNFGDGQTSSLTNPPHIYTYSGTFSPSLFVSQGGVNNTLVKTNYITITSNISNTTDITLSGQPKLVNFRVQTIWGVPITDATVTIQGITTTAGTYDWIVTLLNIPLNEAPVQNTLLTGTTDTYGQIEFMMVPTVKYNVTATAPGYTFPAQYIMAHDNEYFIIANPLSDQGWIEPTFNATNAVTVTVVSMRTSDNYQGLNITYTDSSSTTTGGFVNITQLDPPNNYKTILSFPIVASTFTIDQDVIVPVGGTSVKVDVNSIVSGVQVSKSFGADFKGGVVSIGGVFDPTLLMWGALFLIVLTALLAGASTSPQVALIVCVEAWIFLAIGWLNPMIDRIGAERVTGLIALATFITILWIIREGKRKEVGR